MSKQNLGYADAALQDNYVEPIVRAVADKTWIIDKVQKDSKHIESNGRRAVWSAHTRRNKGRKTIVEGGTLPGAGRQGFDPMQASIKYHTYAIEITDAAIEATANNQAAFTNLLTEETKGVARDMKQDIARQSYGTGTGVLCNITGGGTTATSVLPVDSVQYVEIGDPVDVIKRSDGTGANVGTSVVDVDYVNLTITVGTFDAAGNATAANITGTVDNTFAVYVSGNRNMEMDGLRNIISDTGTVHGLDRSLGKYSVFRSRVLNSGGSVAGETLYQQLRDSVNARGFGEVEEFLTTFGVRRRLAATYASQKRMNDAQAVKVHGGYTAIWVDETPVLVDPLMPKGEVFALNASKLAWFEQTPPGWLKQKDSSIFHLKNAGTGQHEATWQAYWRWYAVLGSFHPGALGRIKNCQDDAAESA